MATTDVPGAVKANNDVLDVGCWAEHKDGSLILVKGFESASVIFEIYDLTTDPVLNYQDSMPIDGFKKQFSWDPNNKDSIKWTWHDKTGFPWDRIMKKFKPGVNYADADAQITMASKVAQSRGLKGNPIEPDKLKHMTDISAKKNALLSQIQGAIDQLPPDKLDAKAAEVAKVINAPDKPKGLFSRIFGKS